MIAFTSYPHFRYPWWYSLLPFLSHEKISPLNRTGRSPQKVFKNCCRNHTARSAYNIECCSREDGEGANDGRPSGTSNEPGGMLTLYWKYVASYHL